MLEMSELRPCFVTYADANQPSKSYRALFHGWAELEKPVMQGNEAVACFKTVNAIVELANGHVKCVLPDAVQFLDTWEVFEHYNYWPKKSEDEYYWPLVKKSEGE